MPSIAQAHHLSTSSRASPNPSFQVDPKKYPRILPITSSSHFSVLHSYPYRYPHPCTFLSVLHCIASTLHLPRHLLFHHAPPMIYMLPLLNHSFFHLIQPCGLLSSFSLVILLQYVDMEGLNIAYLHFNSVIKLSTFFLDHKRSLPLQ